MTPQDFIAKWGAPAGVPGPAYALNEEQGAQSHFLDLCELLGVPKSGSAEGYEFKTNPVLDTLEHIECCDALLDWGTAQTAQKQGAVQTPAPAPGAAQVSGSDHDFAQQNSCSDPETGTPPHPGPPGAAAAPQEATWPTANVVIGNPPFLGDKKMRAELGDAYTTLLRKTYEGRVPGGAHGPLTGHSPLR